MTEEAEALAAALATAQKVAERLEGSLKALRGVLPLSETSTVGETDQERIDAFLKRFEQLQDVLSRRLIRTLLIAVGENIAGFSARDAFARMETLGGLHDAERFLAIAKLRHALTHEYPMAEARQRERLNMAWGYAPQLLHEFQALRHYADRLRKQDIQP